MKKTKFIKIIPLFIVILFLISGNSLFSENQNINELQIIYPNGGEKICTGSLLQIKWSYSDFDELKNIYIWDGITKEMFLIASVHGNEYIWEVPDYFKGDRFRIKVELHGNSQRNYYNMSNNFFTIKEPGHFVSENDEIQMNNSILQTELNTSKKINLIPNPSNGILELIFDEAMEIHNISIIDINGVYFEPKSYENHNTFLTMDISNLVCGTYFILFEGNRGSLTKKLIKQ